MIDAAAAADDIDELSFLKLHTFLFYTGKLCKHINLIISTGPWSL